MTHCKLQGNVESKLKSMVEKLLLLFWLFLPNEVGCHSEITYKCIVNRVVTVVGDRKARLNACLAG